VPPVSVRPPSTIPAAPPVQLSKSPRIQKKVTVTEPSITLFLYDHRAIDHDTIDIYVDGTLLIADYEIRHFQKGETFEIPLDFLSDKPSHTVAIVAKNYGSAGTRENTVGYIIEGPSGTLERGQIIISKLGQPVAIKLDYKPG
jgi:hypothetical protein